ncbi:Pentatricopeptide repeat - like 10 [Theobroma cacao]|nr:Pentatricopeptide repeat - like 10 [Theobroma cacao]
MALLSRVRASTTAATLRLRHFSILAPDSSTPLTSHQKTRAALSLLKSEQNPDRILEICRAASLTPASHLDRITFSVAISKLSEGKHFQSIDTFLHELRSRPDLQNERFASHSLILYGQAKMLNHALTAFDEFYNEGLCRSAKSLNALLVAGIVSKDYEEVKRIFVEFPKSKGVQPNATTFGTLLAGFYKEEMFEDVGKVLNLMKEYGVPVGVSTYNTRIQSLCMLKKSTEAKALLDGMLSRGMKPNTVTYNNLIHGFCKEGNLEEAKRLFKSMRNSGLEPDSQCYFTLVHFSCQGGDFEAALSICKESMEKNWVPSFSSMKSLVNGLSSMSKVEEAKELIQKVKEKFSKNADLWDEVEKSLPQ